MKGNVSDFMAVEPRCREDRLYPNPASTDGCREASASRQFRTTFDVPVVVQPTRLDSRQPSLALMSTTAYPV